MMVVSLAALSFAALGFAGGEAPAPSDNSGSKPVAQPKKEKVDGQQQQEEQVSKDSSQQQP